ncbi:hypothetical protein MKW92_021752 [Papaver armeniacum]|nr:hypothetical protein MKW92_021752 [Papaver armeniacum]
MYASKDVLALASLKVYLSSIEPGSTVTVKWHGKAVFIRSRSEDDIKYANSVDQGTMCDPEDDAVRGSTQNGLLLLVSVPILVASFFLMPGVLWFFLSMLWFSLRYFRQDSKGLTTKEPAVPTTTNTFWRITSFFMLLGV